MARLVNTGRKYNSNQLRRKKALFSIIRSLESDSKIIDTRSRQPKKQHLPNTSTEDGIFILAKKDIAKAFSSILCSLEVDSKVTDIRSWHSEKHSSPNISTREGRAIRGTPDLLKALSSILCSLEFDSKVTDVRRGHLTKHPPPIPQQKMESLYSVIQIL
jgi:hypothetical protein